VLATVAYGVSLWSSIDSFAFTPTGSASGGTTYLLLGSDSREFATSDADRTRFGGADATPGQRADVSIALRIEEDGSARVLTISRDLLVSAPGGGLVRVSETFSSGPQAVAETLCRSIGLGVDHAMVLELDGLRRLVDAVGGIYLTLDGPVRDTESGLALSGGRVHLDGNDAIAFVGSRHLEHRTDDGKWVERRDEAADRPGRAVEMLRLLGDDLDLSVWSPLRSNRVLWAAASSVTMDDSVGVSEMNSVRHATSDLDGVTAVRLPVRTSGGAVAVDQLEEGAGERLADFEGAAPRKTCSDPTFPAARR
jgi:LCP family protein required for cell wall assembly